MLTKIEMEMNALRRIVTKLTKDVIDLKQELEYVKKKVFDFEHKYDNLKTQPLQFKNTNLPKVIDKFEVQGQEYFQLADVNDEFDGIFDHLNKGE